MLQPVSGNPYYEAYVAASTKRRSPDTGYGYFGIDQYKERDRLTHQYA